MASIPIEPLNVDLGYAQSELPSLARWAALALCQDFAKLQNEVEKIPTHEADEYHLLPVATNLHPKQIKPTPEGYKVGIIGAGAAGMFTAMIFDYLNEHYGLNVKYEILEAEKERVGGRLYTHKFPDLSKLSPEDPRYQKDYPTPGKHDYYDVGAMRFPNALVMARTFQLFKELKMDFNLNKDPSTPPKAGDMVPYFMKGVNEPVLFNGIQVVRHQDEQKNWVPALSAKVLGVPGIPIGLCDDDAGNLAGKPIQPILDKYTTENPEVFWKCLKDEVDLYSARQYFIQKQVRPWANYDYNTIEFMETVDFGCRWYDQAASEMVLEAINFDPKADWWCIEEGATQIALRMHKAVKDVDAFGFDKLVTAISYKDTQKTQVDVTVEGETSARTYDAVFNSATLSAQQHMHLEGLKLNWGTKCAIRNLGYGASCKVGVRFRTMWWKDPNGLNITKGGVAKTDLPIHFCVYPSYNIPDDWQQPGVLLVSYTWSQEAERIGSLISRDSPNGEEQLRKLITHNLARLHSKTDSEEEYQKWYKLIDEQWLDHYAYDWYANPLTGGAFAWFGPQQFSNLYNDITASDGRYVIIGEASSAHHGWVVGALESAVRGVYQFLYQAQYELAADAPASKAFQAYNKKEIPGPFGPLPAEFDRPKDVFLPADFAEKLSKKEETTIEQKIEPVGELARMGVLVEQIRLEQERDVIDYSSITRAELAPLLELVPNSVVVEA